MPEPSKFSGALAKLNQRPVEQILEQHIAASPTRGRPPGKRSDPDFQATTVLLRKNTKKKATRMLEDTGEKMDLSDLIERLLSEWIEQQS